jgi:hypothetical protein
MVVIIDVQTHTSLQVEVVSVGPAPPQITTPCPTTESDIVFKNGVATNVSGHTEFLAIFVRTLER